MSIAIAGCKEITKLQKRNEMAEWIFFNSIFLLQNSWIKFLLIKKRLRPAIKVGFLNKMQHQISRSSRASDLQIEQVEKSGFEKNAFEVLLSDYYVNCILN